MKAPYFTYYHNAPTLFDKFMKQSHPIELMLEAAFDKKFFLDAYPEPDDLYQIIRHLQPLVNDLLHTALSLNLYPEKIHKAQSNFMCAEIMLTNGIKATDFIFQLLKDSYDYLVDFLLSQLSDEAVKQNSDKWSVYVPRFAEPINWNNTLQLNG